MRYKILDQKNKAYDEINTTKKELLYEGGQSIIDNAALFIPKEIMESTSSYQARLACASYKNYFSEIVNSYTAEVFSKSLAIMPTADADDKSTPGENIDVNDDFYTDFTEDVDLKGTPFTNLLKNSLTEAMVSGKSLLQIDFPKADIKPLTLQEEEELGTARAYLIPIPSQSMIDWEIDDQTGCFNFCVLKSEYSKRKSITDSRDLKTIRFKVWEKSETGAAVSWKVFELTLKQNKQPKPEDECILIDQGVVSFPEIPIMSLEIPKELFVGNLIGNLCSDHFKRYSSLIHAENRSLFALPVYKMGPEFSSSGDLSEISQDTNRGVNTSLSMRNKGFAVIGPADEISFAEPAGKAYELVNSQLQELTTEIHNITHLMAQGISGSSNSNRLSGVAKIVDNRAKEIVLTAYGKVVKQFVLRIYKLISKARNEDISWKTLGLDDYKLTLDREQILKEAVSIQLISIPSRTFKKAFLNQIASQLLDSLTPQELLVIKNEISESIDTVSDDELYSVGIEKEDDEEEMPAKKEDKSTKTSA